MVPQQDAPGAIADPIGHQAVQNSNGSPSSTEELVQTQCCFFQVASGTSQSFQPHPLIHLLQEIQLSDDKHL